MFVIIVFDRNFCLGVGHAPDQGREDDRGKEEKEVDLETETGVEVAHDLEVGKGAAPETDQEETLDEVVQETEEATGAVLERGRDPILGKDEGHVQEMEEGDHGRERGGEGHEREDDRGQGTESKSGLETDITDKD